MLDLRLLNEKQKDAVESLTGPVLVLAGAGSGKTKALTYRIANILEQNLATEQEILAVTFTNKAATEMKERVMKLLINSSTSFQHSEEHNSTKAITFMGTFHSICVKILRTDGKKIGTLPNFVIYDEDDAVDAIKSTYEKLGLNIKELNPKAVKATISSAKNELIDTVQFQNLAQGYYQNNVAKVYIEYQKVLKESSALDFDDLIMKVINLFEGSDETLQKYQSKFKYILVDEYQDTNHAQYKLVKLLAEKYKNICVVGDEDQSIYKFRGSDIRNILNFERDFPGCKIIKLEQNYRSTEVILNSANSIIKKNSQRLEKSMWTQVSGGELITQHQAEDEKAESKYIADKIEEIIDNKADQSIVLSIGVLYRSNAQSRNIEEALIQKGIPYRLVGGIRFYERKEIKDVIAYLRVLINPKDTLSLMRIINTPRREVGKKVLSELETLSREHNLSIGELLLDEYSNIQVESHAIGSVIKLFRNLKSKLNEIDLPNFIDYLITETGYKSFLDDGTEEGKARLENIFELKSACEKFVNNEINFEENLSKFLEQIALLESDEMAKEKENRLNYLEEKFKVKVNLMTIHASKGLEFDFVFLPGFEENLFPHSRSLLEVEELEEERRLAYVAVTRARSKLFILHAYTRRYFGAKQTNPLSRFAEDIPEVYKEVEEFDGAYNNFSYSKSSKFDFDDFEFESESKFEKTYPSLGEELKNRKKSYSSKYNNYTAGKKYEDMDNIVTDW
ncbi:UvrD-helicase domain-containing protein [bacterium]|nr:MAG: UvrD-helicase domain-containing protein [bacterium]